VTIPLYLDDAYARATTARVVARGRELAEPDASDAEPSGDVVVLDRTILYAESGGQPGDHGWMRWRGGEARVVDSTWRGKEAILHRLDGPAPPVGTEVAVEVDWPRRHGLMRHHTAVHVLSAVVADRWKALFTGGQLYPEKARLDAEFAEWKPEMTKEIEAAVNAVVARDLPVSHATIPREEYERGGYSRLRDVGVDPAIREVRLTVIGDPAAPFDRQADGGTHVRSTREVGRVVLDKSENKGKGHRRIALHVE
jgi:misacylated tRNA(Ala) deacylase